MTKPKPPKDYSKQKALLDRLYASGMTQAAFAKQEGMPATQLGYWVKQDRTVWRPNPGERIASAVETKDRLLAAVEEDRDAPGAIAARVRRDGPKLPSVEQQLAWEKETVEQLRAEVRDWEKRFNDQEAKIEALQKVVLVLGYQL